MKTDGFLDDKTGQEPSSWKETSCPHNEREQLRRHSEALGDVSPATLHSGWAGGFSMHLPCLQNGRISPQTKEGILKVLWRNKWELTNTGRGFKKCKAAFQILAKCCTCCSAGSVEKYTLHFLCKHFETYFKFLEAVPLDAMHASHKVVHFSQITQTCLQVWSRCDKTSHCYIWVLASEETGIRARQVMPQLSVWFPCWQLSCPTYPEVWPFWAEAKSSYMQ